MAHDRYCPLDPLPEAGCVVCADLRAARAEERGRLQASWQETLRDIERREYARGWTDGVNGRPASP